MNFDHPTERIILSFYNLWLSWYCRVALRVCVGTLAKKKTCWCKVVCADVWVPEALQLIQ